MSVATLAIRSAVGCLRVLQLFMECKSGWDNWCQKRSLRSQNTKFLMTFVVCSSKFEMDAMCSICLRDMYVPFLCLLPTAQHTRDT